LTGHRHRWRLEIRLHASLLSVVLISSLLAMFLQALSAKLGIATGRDLALGAF
jgi:Mn2+/Fe2+ NRAMP family transporter